MAKAGLIHVLLCPLLLVALLQSCHGQERQVHIVYMGELPRGDFSGASTHHSMLEGVLGSTSSAKESLIYSYGKSFNGFAAKLTDDEVAKLSEMEGVISVFPDRKLKLHTTRSWDFMGVTKPKRGSPQEGDVIIGLLDTGIWPESESFSDEGLSPPPSKWKGECQGANFTCNNKIIGARYYNSDNSDDDTDFKSPRDSEGHGTHTSSTAAGREVVGASYFGLAEGTATGGVPGARIAVYKVCWSFGCSSADILAGFDDAIADGVDVISVSLGSDFPGQYFEDPIAIGSFHAMRKGILTSASAGNSGPFPSTVSNFAPWIQTVAASTIDRKFVAQVALGNGQVYTGVSINSFDLNGKSFPLIWGGGAVNYSAGADTTISKFCFPGALNSHKVQGKIVLCETIDGIRGIFIASTGVSIANGVGTIMAADSSINDFAFSYSFPATVISTEDGLKVLDYIKSTENPIATILVGETWKDVMAPYVVSFSSRGPNPITPDILKPDLTAPGVDILAAWSPVAPPSIDSEDTRSVKFNVISGTSMSCPHASGAAAYVKAVHPNWSPAAIKSALMTTAYVVDAKKHEDLEFAYGSGHINPLKAIDPGLIYDASEADYIDFLCKQGYNTTTLKLITGDNSSFCTTTVPGRAWSLNYPSFSIAVEDGLPIRAVFSRTVTNVGPPNSTYTLSWYMPSSLTVRVEPSVLSFSAIGEKKSFTVTVYGPKIEQQPITSGAITWTYGVHVVRSPLVVYTILPGSSFSFSASQNKPNFKGSSMYHNNGILGGHK
ncbi:cucumisin-like [Juglans microcarpa x Juglans regia]|uniref:cucumisin-like n=1 Tax=Juglans microcarpa x Juglans regia TaxID=2249226 RepID=UPI001B7EE9B7|nr:cucumisin-like [Juglans microcarpa x Juglans regia]